MNDSLWTSTQVAPSILSANFGRLGEQVGEVLGAGAKVIHVDVMDGHFVPPISFGAVAVKAIADQVHAAGGVIDVHLMIEQPERHVDEFASAGADSITVHVEAAIHLHGVLSAIRAAGCRAGAAVCPSTPIAPLAEVSEVLDLALCMSVNPGWGGQKFIEESVGKLARMRELLPERVALEVDGGIDTSTIGRARAAGAGVFVAGSAVFGAGHPAAAFDELKRRLGA